MLLEVGKFSFELAFLHAQHFVALLFSTLNTPWPCLVQQVRESGGARVHAGSNIANRWSGTTGDQAAAGGHFKHDSNFPL
jgi:hypothetical protein